MDLARAALVQSEPRLETLADRIDRLLPQTQCRQCGQAGCRPYAEAIAAGRAAINQCAPGGDEVIRELAALLGVPPLPLDPAFGAHEPPAVALIDEARCIGCTLCIQACPVDAIVGAAGFMHTVIAAECTGCRLCLPPCPVDCIELHATGAAPTRERRMITAARARRRYEARLARLDRERSAAARRNPRADAGSKKRATVRRAIERARARLQRRAPR